MIDPMLPVVSMAIVSAGPTPSSSLISLVLTAALMLRRYCLVASFAAAAAAKCR